MIEKTVNIEALRENILKLKEISAKNSQKTEILSKKNKKTHKLRKRKYGCPPKFCAVVKANAYGHGYKEVCNGIADLVDYFAVANVKEALQVRALKLKKRILILGKVSQADLPTLIKKGIRLTVDSLQDVEFISTAAADLSKRAYVHIKVNTGMNRLGVKTPLQLQTLLTQISNYANITVEGVYTHFATADSDNSYKLKRQNAKFQAMLDVIDNKKIIAHASNSSAFLRSGKFCYDMVRVGLAMYGYTNSTKVALKPCLQVRAKVVKTQTLQKGESVGYGASFVATHRMQIAVVAIGYADGYARAYQNGVVLICGQKCPIVGRVCMDMLMCDITNLKLKTTYTCSGIFDNAVNKICDTLHITPTFGDEVMMLSFKSMIQKSFPRNYNLYKSVDDLFGVDPKLLSHATLLGSDGEEEITAQDLAKLSNTIEYEVLTNFNLLRE